MDEEEKKLLESYNRLSRKSRLLALAQIIGQAEMEEIAREIARGKAVLDPFYADRNPVPIGEAVNG
jgi:hypothetical protein